MKRAARWVIGALFLVVLTVVGLRYWALQTLRSVSSADSIARAESRVIVRGASATLGSVRTLPPDVGGRLTSPAKRTADRMGEAFRDADIRRAALAVMDSDDPAVWVQSLQLSLMCMNPRFSSYTPVYTAEMFESGKNKSAAEIDAIVKQLNDFRVSPPSRVAFPPALRGIVGDLLTTLFTSKEQNFDPELAKALNDAQFAPVGAMEVASRTEIFQQTQAMCQSGLGEDFLHKYREAGDRWTAKGALGALIGDKKSGWTSANLRELTDADYALVERAILERQPDGLARLLSPGNSSLPNLLELSDAENSYALILAISGSRQVAQLTLCQLDIADCSVDSPAFKDACAWYGGCHQTDLGSLMRYVFARDEMDPTLIDRNAARVVAAIYANDLDALGIRRVTEKK